MREVMIIAISHLLNSRNENFLSDFVTDYNPHRMIN